MNIKHILVSTAALVAATSAFADGTVSQSSHTASVKVSNIVANGQVQAPSPSLIYFSDASYPVQQQAKSNVSRAEVKAGVIQAAGKNQVIQ